MFEVLAAATELLLDRLVLVCSRVIIRHCNAYNAAALACEASFYQAITLKNSIFDYIVSCMETMLESGLLDEMHEDVLLDLCQHIGEKQLRKLGASRSGELVNTAMEKWKDWLAIQDIPVPRVRQPWRWKPRSPLVAPINPTSSRARKTPSPVFSPDFKPASGQDDIFAMDDEMATPPSTSAVTPRSSRPMTPLDLSAGSGKGAVWRSRAVEAEKVDLRSVMAEAAATKTPQRSTAKPGQTPPGPRPGFASSSSTPVKSPALARSPPSSSSGPWRPLDRSKSSFSAVQTSQSSSRPTPQRSMGSQASPVPAAQANVITPVKLQPAPSGSQRKQS